MFHFIKGHSSHGMQWAVYACNARLGFKIRGQGVDDDQESLTMSIREVTARIAKLSILETKVDLEVRSIFLKAILFRA